MGNIQTFIYFFSNSYLILFWYKMQIFIAGMLIYIHQQVRPAEAGTHKSSALHETTPLVIS